MTVKADLTFTALVIPLDGGAVKRYELGNQMDFAPMYLARQRADEPPIGVVWGTYTELWATSPAFSFRIIPRTEVRDGLMLYFEAASHGVTPSEIEVLVVGNETRGTTMTASRLKSDAPTPMNGA